MEDAKLILWVEDEPGPAKKGSTIMEKFFLREGYKLNLVGTAKEALTFLRKEKYVGVILDVMVPAGEEKLRPKNLHPSMGGVSVIEKIQKGSFKRYGNGPKLPIIVISGVVFQDVLERVHDLLGSDSNEYHLMKPVPPEKVVSQMKKALGDVQ